jgi:hypothetical protein
LLRRRAAPVPRARLSLGIGGIVNEPRLAIAGEHRLDRRRRLPQRIAPAGSRRRNRRSSTRANSRPSLGNARDSRAPSARSAPALCRRPPCRRSSSAQAACSRTAGRPLPPG